MTNKNEELQKRLKDHLRKFRSGPSISSDDTREALKDILEELTREDRHHGGEF